MTEQEIIEQLHPDLQKVIENAKGICEVPFKVVEGKRSKYRQDLLWYKGEDMSDQTSRSLGCAITVCAYLDDIPCFGLEIYMEIADAFRYAGQNTKVDVMWGGTGRINLLERHELMDKIYEKVEFTIRPRIHNFELYYEK